MRRLFFIFWFMVVSCVATYGQATLSPLNPVVTQNQQVQFSVSGSVGTSPVWSCSGCAGSINQSSLYTAPATITPNNSIAGYSLHPNDHIYNTRIDSLGVNANNTTWVNVVRPVNKINYLASFPLNYSGNSALTGLSVTDVGSGTTEVITVTSAPASSGPLFKLVFDAADNWGLDQWYDLVNDPSATTNLGQIWSVNGPSAPCEASSGLAQMVFYGDNDKSLFIPTTSACGSANLSRSMTILQSSSSLVVLQSTGHPGTNLGFDTNVTGTVTYYIYPNGQIYIHNSVSVVNAQDLSAGGLADLYILDHALNDPAQTGTTPPDSQTGWVRAVADANPWEGNGRTENYVFEYWDSTTPTYGNFTKASIMSVPSPNNPTANYYPILHSWGCGTGCGVVRYGYRIDHSSSSLYNLSAGQTISFDWLIQLGTQNSSILPNITSSAVAGPIATAYRNNPNPNAGGVPTDTMSFYYTSANNGVFETPQWPNALIEGGFFDARTGGGGDHHLIYTNTTGTSGAVSERYQYYCTLPTTGASVASNVATITFATDPAACGLYNGRSICVGSFTGGDTYFNNCPVTITALSSASKNLTFALTHANGTATTTGNVTLNNQTTGCSTAGTCNGQSGVKYGTNDYTLPANGSTDAAGLELSPLILKEQELEQAVATNGTINHALRVTFAIGFEASSFLWPATANASDGGTVPFGARARLKSAYDCSISGAGGITSTIGNILCKQLQQYGLINADGGNNWQVNIEMAPWPKAYNDAFSEVNNAAKTSSITNISINGSNQALITASSDVVATSNQIFVTGTTQCGGAVNGGSYTVVSNSGGVITVSLTHASCAGGADSGTVTSPLTNYMEFVDESGLMVSSSSGATNPGERVTYTSSTGSVSTNVALQGPAVNMQDNVIHTMAGTPGFQLTVFTSADSGAGLAWTMNPSLGSLTSSGIYTPPSSVASATSTTVTATSHANANVAAQMTIWVFPTSGINIVQNNIGSDYTASDGKVYKAGWGLGMSNVPNIQGCCQVDGSFPNITDKQLWNTRLFSSPTGGTDYRMDFRVPKGCYNLAYRNGTTITANTNQKYFYVNGNLVMTADETSWVGGLHLPFTLSSEVQVGSDGKLAFYNVPSGQGEATVSGDISSVSITPGCNSVTKKSGHMP